MKIDSVELFHVALPLAQPREAAGRRLETLETVLVCMRSGDLEGWGEASPGNAPLAGAEWAAGVFACLRDWLAPTLSGTHVDSGDHLQQRLEPFRGNRFAKGALDSAWWDLEARRQGRPLPQLLGAKRTAVELGVTFDRMDSVDEFISAIGRAFEAGFARVKLKFRPGWDIRMVEAVRKEFPSQTLQIDCEGGMRLDLMDLLCRLDDFCLAMIEQPLPPDDLVGHAMVQEAIRTPVCLDESVTSLAQAEIALELKSCRSINLKPGRVGGLTPAMAIHDVCRDGGVSCWVAATPQSAIGVRTGLALAGKENCTYPADYVPVEGFLAQDLAEPLLPAREQPDAPLSVRLWSEPGIGIVPDPALLERFCVARSKVGG